MKQGWEIKKLGEVCDFQGGSQPPKEEWISEEREGYVRMLQIRDFTQTRSVEAEYVKITNRLKFCQSDDVLIGRYGASVGKILTGLSGAYNVAIMKSVPNSKVLMKPFFKYFLSSPSFQDFLLQASAMRAAQAGFSKEDIQDYPLPVPPIAKQETIVAELDCLSRIIEKKKQQLEELDALAQSIFYEMFGDPAENDKGWDVKMMGNVVNVRGGYAFKSTLFTDKGVPVLRIGNINTGKLKADSIVFYKEDKSLEKYVVYPNDLVISLTGTAGKDDYGNVCVLDNTYPMYYLNQRNAKIELSSEVVTEYIKYVLKDASIKARLTGINRGVRQGNISNKDIESLLIQTPPINLQNDFALKIESIEKQKELIAQSIKETETLFNSRMDYYFN